METRGAMRNTVSSTGISFARRSACKGGRLIIRSRHHGILLHAPCCLCGPPVGHPCPTQGCTGGLVSGRRGDPAAGATRRPNAP
eukprot:1691949-Prorocentrum_lima.AAC.1